MRHQRKCDVNRRSASHERHGQNRFGLLSCLLLWIHWTVPAGAPTGLRVAVAEHSRDDSIKRSKVPSLRRYWLFALVKVASGNAVQGSLLRSIRCITSGCNLSRGHLNARIVADKNSDRLSFPLSICSEP